MDIAASNFAQSFCYLHCEAHSHTNRRATGGSSNPVKVAAGRRKACDGTAG